MIHPFDIFNGLFLIFLMIVMVYPLLHAGFASISNPDMLVGHRGLLLWPYQPVSLFAYESVFANRRIASGYQNTLIYLFLGTTINLVLTSMAAYTLSLKNLMFRNFIMFAVTFTMLFSGGLIPTFITVFNLGLVDTTLAMVLPSAINTFNLIIMITAFKSIPDSLHESAKIDGANDIFIFTRIVLPLSVPVLAVMTLYYGVFHWNSWFPAAIYLRSPARFPLQIILRDILIHNTTDAMHLGGGAGDRVAIAASIRYATIMVATVPILFVYPFLQKHFTKGVMIGAIKG